MTYVDLDLVASYFNDTKKEVAATNRKYEAPKPSRKIMKVDLDPVFGEYKQNNPYISKPNGDLDYTQLRRAGWEYEMEVAEFLLDEYQYLTYEELQDVYKKHRRTDPNNLKRTSLSFPRKFADKIEKRAKELRMTQIELVTILFQLVATDIQSKALYEAEHGKGDE